MDLRPLGNTGLNVSPIGLGTVKLGRSLGVKYPTPVRIPSDAEAATLLETARDLGVNLIDTAPAYGHAEERLGKLLPPPRESWVIATKAGESFDNNQSTFDFSPAAITRSVERSLARLRTDHLDIVLLHSAGQGETTYEETGAFDALRRLKAAGKLRAFGVSTKTIPGARHAIAFSDVVMLTINPVEHADAVVLPEAVARGVGVLVKKALASGHIDRLTDRSSSPAVPLIDPQPDSPPDPIEAALRGVFSRPGVSAVVVGTSNPANLKADVEAARRVLSPAHTDPPDRPQP